ncbi:GyrI-like domain-containing protein, partial [Miniimonas arenae]
WVSWVAGPDPVEGEGWQVVSLPAVERAAVLTYRGAMAGIGEAWANLWAAVSADGHSATGPSPEVYLVSDGPQESWVTELQIPVA